jgi:Domain of unknown function (DUF4136)
MKIKSQHSGTAGLAVFLLVLTFAPAVAAQDVQTDYDKSKNFAEYHTYYWAKIESANPLMNQRVQAAIDAELSNKGWSKQQAGGDVAIVALGMTDTKKDLHTFYTGSGWGYGGFYGAGGMGSSTTTVSEYKQGTLVVDLYDSNSRQLLWRGTATDTLSDKPEKNEKKVNKAVAKMFKKFPPQPESDSD